MTAVPDLVVVGGGLIGLATAFEAASLGLSVTLLEAQTTGRHASSASAGGVRSLNRHPLEIPLARAALDDWDGLAARLGADVGFVRSGQVRVAEDEAALARLEARAALTRDLGHGHEEIVGRAALHAMEPALARHALGALVVRDDGFADPLKTVQAYRAAALRLGVRIEEGVRVAGVAAGPDLAMDTDAGEYRARAVVNAAGAWGGALAAGAGDPVPMRQAALQMIVTEPLPPFVTAVIGSEGHRLSLKQTAGGHVIIGGGHEGVVADTSAGPAGRTLPGPMATSMATALRVFPCLSTARIARSWAGLEGMVADGLPVLGESAHVPGLFHAFGFSAHGFALAPLIGRRIADSIAGQQLARPFDGFGPERFAANQEPDKDRRSTP